MDTLKELETKNIKGKIITTTYLNFTEPKALEKLQEFENIDLKVFIANKEIGFHTKAYIFENKDNYKIIIGSSNITQSALKSNIEWNVRIISKEYAPFIKDVLKEYDNLWNMSSELSDEVLQKYMLFLNEIKKMEVKRQLVFESFQTVQPNKMQVRAMENLNRLREHGENKALVIAATGTGKTYMSAFDVRQFNPKRMLFVVHREEILKKAKETFDKVLKGRNIKTGLFTGNKKEYDADYLFATIQTMNRYYEEFDRDYFDYIVIDEAHHAASNSYLNIINYFKAQFTLGMTATPERGDSLNVFDLFDNNIALEVRLYEALEDDLVIPFHYFGITDIQGVDLENVNLDDISEVANRLMVNRRVDFIIDKMNFYGHDGKFRKVLGFCANIEHAKYMADEFNKRKIKSVALSGNDSVEKRQEYIKKLESDKDDLQVIFTVDIFNEGVDIPKINTVLMLRPTNSPIIFIQQLGRGLRKSENKEFLTVLDFIGNHNKTFLIPIALSGARYYDKDSLKVAVATDFIDVPGCTNIQIDEISKERILSQIERENFTQKKYLKEEYDQFKSLCGGKIPYMLLDYIKYDGAPDPIKFIDKEIEKTKIGEKGRIILKMNSLTDRELIDKLSEASQAGVKIDMIVRGICCLIPGIKGKTDNITIQSIVGQFLEHSRVYCFGEGKDMKMYIASADYMTRNMDKRVEVGCPIYDEDIKKRILNIINVMLHDNVKGRVLQSDGSYKKRKNESNILINSQEYFMEEAIKNATKQLEIESSIKEKEEIKKKSLLSSHLEEREAEFLKHQQQELESIMEQKKELIKMSFF